MSILLTGITTSGTPHLGNYVGAIKPSIEESKKFKDTFLFLADYHSLIKNQDPKLTFQSSLQIASAWIACGIDLDKVNFYRQSNIPQILELNWILSSVTPKGILNRAHAYKAAVDANDNNDPDKGINAGLFNYPILMAADILLFDAKYVPVGSDQKQHIEMTRDIAGRFNNTYGKTFDLPEPIISEDISLLPGLDGRKMSKSYNNFIELFSSEKKLQKSLNQIITDSLLPGEPKETKDSILFEYFNAFASKDKIYDIEKSFKDGAGWGDLKKMLFNIINEEIKPLREKFDELVSKPKLVEEILIEGENKARKKAEIKIIEIREKVGIKALNG